MNAIPMVRFFCFIIFFPYLQVGFGQQANIASSTQRADSLYEVSLRMMYLNQEDEMEDALSTAEKLYQRYDVWEQVLACQALRFRMDIRKQYRNRPLDTYYETIALAEQKQLQGSAPMGTVYEACGKYYQEREQADSSQKYLKLAQRVKQTHFSSASLEMAELHLSWSYFFLEEAQTKAAQRVLDTVNKILWRVRADSANLSTEKNIYVRELLGDTYENLSAVLVLAGLEEEVQVHNRMSLGFREEVPHLDSIKYAKNFMLTGYDYFNHGDIATGIAFVKQALHIYEQPLFSSCRAYSEAFGELGGFYYEDIGYSSDTYLHQALFYQKASLDVALKLGAVKETGIAYLRLGLTSLKLNQVDSARYYFQLGEPYFIGPLASNPQMLAQYFAGKFIEALYHGHFEDAIFYAKKQYEQEEIYGDSFSHNRSICLRGLAFSYLNAGAIDTALDYFYQAGEILNVSREMIKADKLPPMSEIRSPYEFSYCLEHIANVYRYWTNMELDSIALFEQYLHKHQLAVSFLDSLQSRSYNEAARAQIQEEFSYMYHNGIQAAFRLYEERKDPQYIHQAWELMEKGKGSMLVSGMQRSVQSFSLEIVQRELMYQQKIADLNRQIRQSEREMDKKRLITLTQSLIEEKESQTSFLSEIEKEYPDYFAKLYSPSPISLSEFQQTSLREGELFLDYYMGLNSFYLIGVTRDTIVFHEMYLLIEDLAYIEELVSLYQHPPSPSDLDDKKETYVKLAHLFYRILLEPIEDLAQSHTLIIAPPTRLSGIPFEALITEVHGIKSGRWIAGRSHFGTDTLIYQIDSMAPLPSYRDLPYVLNKYSIQYAFSGGSLAFNRSHRSPSVAGSVLGMAPVYFPGLDTLFFSDDELEGIKGVYPTREYLHTEATESRFKRSFSDYSIIHLSTHGITDTKGDLQTRLVFHTNPDRQELEDGNLFLSEIYGLPMKAEMVVLSACETGIGKKELAEGSISLGRGFRYAGARSVLMNLWQVNDQIANQIMTRFYQNIADGQTKDIALKEAKTEFLANCYESNTHPYYWATSVLYGSADPILPPWWFMHKRKLILLGFCLLLSLIIGVSIRRFWRVTPESVPESPEFPFADSP